MTPSQMARLFEPPRRRVMLAVGRAVLRAVDDAGGLQRLQVTLLAGETRDGVERVQSYGLSAVPLAGADAVVVCIGGNRDHPVAIAVDDRRHRPTGLGPGEVCLYTHLAGKAGGHRITLRQDQTIEVEALQVVIKGQEKVRVETPLLEVTGEVIDSSGAGGLSMSAMRAAYNQHTHPPDTAAPPDPQQVAP